MTGADLPNAFPYFIAIERLVSADISTCTALLVLVAYAAVYCLPCLVLLAVGLSHGERVAAVLRACADRFGTEAVIQASWKRAVVLFVASLALAAIATTA